MQLTMMKLTMMFAMFTVMVSTLPAQAGNQPQPGNLATSNSTAQTGINFANSPSRNVGLIPTKVLMVKEVAGKCAGGAFLPASSLGYSLLNAKLFSTSNSESPSNSNNGSSLPFKASTTTPSTPGSTITSEKPAAPSTPFQDSGFTTRTLTSEGELPASFVSSTTPPALGLRVRIKNVTSGMEGDAPYSDREYHEGSHSEAFTVRFGKQHNNGYLAVREGDNEFTYQIKRGDQIVESGQFKVQVNRQVTTEMQAIGWEQKNYQCKLQNATLNSPSINPIDSPQFIDYERQHHEQIKRDLEKFQLPPISPPQQLPFQIPRIQIPPIQIQQNLQSP